MGYGVEDEAATNAAKKVQAAKDAQDLNKATGGNALNIGGNPAAIDALKRAGTSNPNTTFYNPGSADYGGKFDIGNGVTENGVDFYRNDALGHMGDNDAQQASNRGAMANSLAAMKGVAPGGQSVENKLLSSRADATRASQMGLLNMSRDAALGNAPSEAAFQTKLGFNSLNGGYSAAVGGARGLAALGGAQSQGSAQVGGQAGELAAAGGLARSKEIGDAIGMYGAQAGQVRGQDLSRLGVSNQNNTFNSKTSDDWRVGNANLLAAQGGLGVSQGQTDLAWQGAAMNPADKQFQYDQEMAAIQAGADADKAGESIARDRDAKDNTRNLVNGGVTSGLGLVGSLAGPVGTAAGTAAGQGLATATRRLY